MYETASAFRQAIETRLNQQAREDRIDVNRLRRGFVFERILARLEAGEPGSWVVKGGMALEWRLGNRARGTLDLDLVLRGDPISGDELRAKLIELLAGDLEEDRFLFEVGPPERLEVGFRFAVRANLAGREFASVRVDVAARGAELLATERLQLPRAVRSFDRLSPPQVEVAATSQHFAEKLHALTRDHGEQPNTRVRDLIDLILLIELELVRSRDVPAVVRHVFENCATHAVPEEIPDPPAGWGPAYSQMATEMSLGARTIEDAMSRLRSFWNQARSG